MEFGTTEIKQIGPEGLQQRYIILAIKCNTVKSNNIKLRLGWGGHLWGTEADCCGEETVFVACGSGPDMFFANVLLTKLS